MRFTGRRREEVRGVGDVMGGEVEADKAVLEDEEEPLLEHEPATPQHQHISTPATPATHASKHVQEEPLLEHEPNTVPDPIKLAFWFVRNLRDNARGWVVAEDRVCGVPARSREQKGYIRSIPPFTVDSARCFRL